MSDKIRFSENKGAIDGTVKRNTIGGKVNEEVDDSRFAQKPANKSGLPASELLKRVRADAKKKPRFI